MKMEQLKAFLAGLLALSLIMRNGGVFGEEADQTNAETTPPETTLQVSDPGLIEKLTIGGFRMPNAPTITNVQHSPASSGMGDNKVDRVVADVIALLLSTAPTVLEMDESGTGPSLNTSLSEEDKLTEKVKILKENLLTESVFKIQESMKQLTEERDIMSEKINRTLDEASSSLLIFRRSGIDKISCFLETFKNLAGKIKNATIVSIGCLQNISRNGIETGKRLIEEVKQNVAKGLNFYAQIQSCNEAQGNFLFSKDVAQKACFAQATLRVTAEAARLQVHIKQKVMEFTLSLPSIRSYMSSCFLSVLQIFAGSSAAEGISTSFSQCMASRR